MTPSQQRIQATARWLVVLARLGQVLTIASMLAVVHVMYRIARPWHPGFIDFLSRLFDDPASAMVNGWGGLRVALYVWAFECIRRIGVSLSRYAPISPQVAEAVRGCAWSILLCGFGTLLQFDPIFGPRPGGVPPLDWEFNWMAFHAVCLLCVCVLVIARILHAAVELKAENEGFV